MPALSLADRVAIVTGAAQGIGAAIAAELTARGAQVVAVDLAPVEPAAGITPVRGDVADPATVRAALAAAEGLGGPATVLVQAAFAGTPAPLDELSDAAWDSMLGTVLTAARRFDTAFVRALPPGTPASIVHLASPHAAGAVPGFAAYAAAKAGLLALTRAAAVEWGPRGVRCNAVAPGFVPVERNRRVWTDPELSAALLRAAPLGRFGTAAEVARAVAFLAGDEASFVNGACLAVDGGMTAMLPEALLR
ncbi:NAD(P)-dependent dehydrogenase (short-subunit alcohol dehydrogenase family) [Kitasatospora gansuensis]|uniref:NAD(P)-dependent dehydrogenase (Short-subunit alcohol dehydrogenase family) n=1 Tax=Kitasatospora gansuensis TaxID=258050 RepID=A0A7W7S863_9ACTN|nr:SDR family oxidoreductase [Kitasatospora gansuensis]MBB4945711.1 NAD(P)-dependent dehydrogenase (short-subunit alcohol dehydrogenase family) [Kitasatospora gansuensis]